MKARRRSRTASAAVSAGLLALAVTGCGPADGSVRSHTGATAAKAAPSPAPPATGSQLGRLFPTGSQLPRGWSYTGPDTESDSGTVIEPPRPATEPPVLPHLTCKTADAFAMLSDYAADFAHMIPTVNMGANTTDGDIFLTGYFPGYASRQFAMLTAFASHRCPAFTLRDPITRGRARMGTTVSKAPGLGDQALLISDIQVNGKLPDGTYYPGDYILVVRVGNYILAVDAPNIPGHPEARQVAQVASGLVGRLRKLGAAAG